MFLVQVLIYALGWILFQVGRALINLSKLREDVTRLDTVPPRPTYPQRSN